MEISTDRQYYPVDELYIKVDAASIAPKTVSDLWSLEAIHMRRLGIPTLI